MKKIFMLLALTIGFVAFTSQASKANIDSEVKEAFLYYMPGGAASAESRTSARVPEVGGVALDPTLALLHAVRNWDRLQPETQRELSRYIEVSPWRNGIRTINSIYTNGCAEVLSESSDTVIESTHFKLIYTPSGTHASSSSYAQSVLNEAEQTWTTEVNTIGLSAPRLPSDSKMRIYLCDLLGGTGGAILGRTHTTTTYSDLTAESYIELDNDYNGISIPSGTTAQAYASLVFAHEFFHAIQFSYNYASPSYWLLESNATWIEDEVYPDSNDYVTSYVSNKFNNLHVSIDHFSNSDTLAYGSSIFFRHITENEFSATSFIPTLWTNLKNTCPTLTSQAWCAESTTELALINSLLANSSKDLPTVFRNFNVANYTKDYRDGSLSLFPSVTTQSANMVNSPYTNTSTTNLDHLATHFYLVSDSSGAYTADPVFEFSGNSSASWNLSIIKVLNAGGYSTTHPTMSGNTYDGVLSGFGTTFNTAVVIVNNTSQSADNAAYKLSISYKPFLSQPEISLSNTSVPSSSSNVAAHLLKVKSPVAGTLNGITYTNSSSTSNADSFTWKLYRDNDADGVVDPSDALLKTFTTTGVGSMSITGLTDALTANTSYYYLLAFDRSTAATSRLAGAHSGIPGTIAFILIAGFITSAAGAAIVSKVFRLNFMSFILVIAFSFGAPALIAGCGGGGGGGVAATSPSNTMALSVSSSDLSIVNTSGTTVEVSGETISGPTITLQ